jgi:hypothetical protein
LLVEAVFEGLAAVDENRKNPFSKLRARAAFQDVDVAKLEGLVGAQFAERRFHGVARATVGFV